MVTKLGTAYVRFFGHNEKIVTGLTESDTNKHYLDLSSWVPKNTVAVIMHAVRTSGTGYLVAYPNEGIDTIRITDPDDPTRTTATPKIIAIKNQRLQYSLAIANDVFNIYLFGYFVEYPISRLKKEG